MVENLLQFCLLPEDVRTVLRTELENRSHLKALVGELAILFGHLAGLDAEVKGATEQDQVDDGAIVVALSEELRARVWLVFNGVAGCKPLALVGIEGASEGLVVVDRISVRTVVRTGLPVPRVSTLGHVQQFVGQHSLYHAVSS